MILGAVVETFGFVLFALYQIFRSLILLLVPASYEPVKTVKGETILITGAGGGLGRQLAIRLAKLQAKIVIWDIDVRGTYVLYLLKIRKKKIEGINYKGK